MIFFSCNNLIRLFYIHITNLFSEGDVTCKLPFERGNVINNFIYWLLLKCLHPSCQH